MAENDNAVMDPPPLEMGPPLAERGGYPCPKCGKAFEKPQQLRMHAMRVHTRAGRLGPTKGAQIAARRKSRNARQRFGAITKEEALVRRREAYAALAAEYRARGLNAHGDPFKPGYGPRRRNGAKTLRKRPSSERRTKMRNYAKSYYWRKRAEQGHHVPPDKQYLLMDNQERNGTAQPRRKLGNERHGRLPKQTTAQARHVMFCPVCGTNMENVQTAVNFGD